MKIAPRKPWITEAMINKMDERKKAKTKKVKEYRRLNNQPRRETKRVKEVYMKKLCEEMMNLQRKCKYDLMYQEAKQLGGRTSKAIKYF